MKSSAVSGMLRRTLCVACLLVAGSLHLSLPSVAASDGTIFTLWPVIDSRSAPQDNYTSIGLAGPLLRYERSEKRKRFGLRPLYYRETDENGRVESDILYPLMTYRSNEEESSFQFFHLLTADASTEKGSDFMLFPLLFYRNPPQGEGYFAFFPLGGKILNRFGRDRIEFALFPLYGKTERKGTKTTNLLWPFFSLTRGEDERGWAFWPLYGTAAKAGVYRRSFLLWPFFFYADDRLDSPDPLRTRAIFPFYYFADTPTRTDHTYLWPFFSHIEDSRKDFEEWNFPWPIFRIIDGKDRQMLRLLPFYSDDRDAKFHTRWLMWPIYKEEESVTPTYSSQRQRVLYFLYSHTQEQFVGERRVYKRRTDLWPLFTYEEKDGLSHFSTLALLEPFFPGNEQIERNWSPLWRIYQRRWDRDGNEASTFLWNLYWKERRGDDLLFELFPLLYYRDEESLQRFEFALLKGLYRYKNNSEQACHYLFYLPWGWCYSLPERAPMKESL
jgi:hypothetical protein